ncbi:UDP-3-O-(3-hydroxymyristoyl)glucosamine N-acyltransferase [[Clostridium] innocuum]|nr:UDP-3-O-(3-hydroxymyristoyl)glucosamine N-acyltransferase [[Clostridium] innocuum]MCR0575980.1 UDP-3-O-(3-hydroxymyristoyl)glucosamine N-acyltransferase [[Clostridium] innocuum]
MLLSEFFNEDTVYIREKEFETLGIIDSHPHMKFLSFIDDEIYIKKLCENSDIVMVLVTEELAERIPDSIGICVVKNPRLAFFHIHNMLQTNKAYVRSDVDSQIGENCSISKLAFIAEKNVKIGNNVKIEEFVSIKEGTVIGNDCIIRAGTVIGCPGFEFKKSEHEVMPVNHYGGVVIGDRVEIKCNNVIDKAIYPWDSTEIGSDTKLDDLIYIAHASKIKKRVFICAKSAIAGRVIIEEDTWIGTGCSIRNGIKIGKGARCNMGAVVTKNVEDFQSVTGNFAIDHDKFIAQLKSK